jgi:hypothetical protein
VLIARRALDASALDEAGYLRELQAQPPLPPTDARSDRPAVDWAQEAAAWSRDGRSIRHARDSATTTSMRTRADGQQLRLAGARLADMLNFALDPAAGERDEHARGRSSPPRRHRHLELRRRRPGDAARGDHRSGARLRSQGRAHRHRLRAGACCDCARPQGCRVQLDPGDARARRPPVGGGWLQQRTGAPIGIGAGIRSVQATFKPIYGLEPDFPTDGSQFDRLFDDGERFASATGSGVIATPGHTSDSLSYRIGDAVFVGDSIFMPDGGTARCDFPAATRACCTPRSSACTRCRTTRACSSATTTARRARAARADHDRANRSARTSTCARNAGAEFVELRTQARCHPGLPALILPAVQVNIRGGRLPPPRATAAASSSCRSTRCSPAPLRHGVRSAELDLRAHAALAGIAVLVAG